MGSIKFQDSSYRSSLPLLWIKNLDLRLWTAALRKPYTEINKRIISMLFATLLLSILLGATISVASSNDEQLKAKMEAIDGNGDGCVTIKEWITAWRTENSDTESRLLEEPLRTILEK